MVDTREYGRKINFRTCIVVRFENERNFIKLYRIGYDMSEANF